MRYNGAQVHKVLGVKAMRCFVKMVVEVPNDLVGNIRNLVETFNNSRRDSIKGASRSVRIQELNL